MADADEYRDWAAQQVDTRVRDRMLAEADRIDRRRDGTRVQVNVTIKLARLNAREEDRNG